VESKSTNSRSFGSRINNRKSYLIKSNSIPFSISFSL